MTAQDRAAAVVRRGRAARRRARVAVAGLAVLATLGVAVPVLAGDDGDLPPAGRDEGPPVAVVVCPAVAPTVGGSDTALVTLPEGASSARMCPAGYEGEADPPSDPTRPRSSTARGW